MYTVYLKTKTENDHSKKATATPRVARCVLLKKKLISLRTYEMQEK